MTCGEKATRRRHSHAHTKGFIDLAGRGGRTRRAGTTSAGRNPKIASRNEERLDPAVRPSPSIIRTSDTGRQQQGSCPPAHKACGSEGLNLVRGSRSSAVGRSSTVGRSGFNSSSGGGITTTATAIARRVTTAATAVARRVATAAARRAAATTMVTATATARRRAAATAVARRVTTAAASAATATAIARVTAAAATATATTMTESRSFVLTADEGQANEREENRNTQNNDTVHSKILHLPSKVP